MSKGNINFKGYQRPTEKVIERNPDIPQSGQPNGTNEIFDSLGYSGEERNKILEELGNGEHHKGVEIIKQTHKVTMEAGIKGTGLDTPDKTKDIFYQIAHFIRYNGPVTSLAIAGNKCIVPQNDLDSILTNVGKEPLKSKAAHVLMNDKGYRMAEVGGIRLYMKVK